MSILILGGGYAGVLAALRLANRGLGAQVTLVNGDAELVERVRHHELAAAKPPRRHSIAQLLRRTNVHFGGGSGDARSTSRGSRPGSPAAASSPGSG